MARKLYRTEVLPSHATITTKLGALNAPFRDTEIGKLVKPGTLDSQHVLCAVGDMIDGYVVSVEAATSDGFGVGAVQRLDAKYAVADGSQAAGTGALALGDYVVAGTPQAQGTALGNAFVKVRKATTQVGSVGTLNEQMSMVPFMWRVASLGVAGSGAVGTTILIERIGGPV